MGKIYGKTFGNNTYYYYHHYKREKINKDDKGKTRGTGKSRVVTEVEYLGKAEDILKIVRAAKNEGRVKSVKEIEYGLALALYNIAEKIGLVDIIDKHVAKREQGLSVGEYVLISAINRVGNWTSKEGMGEWVKKTALKYVLGKEAQKVRSCNFYDNFEKILSEKEIKEKKEKLKKIGNSKLDIEEMEVIMREEEIVNIEQDIWYKLHKEFNMQLDLILYDTTAFLTNIDRFTGSSVMQVGHNAKGINNKRQVKIALGCLKDIDIPIFHKVYCGNITDITLFGSAISELIRRYKQIKKGTGKELILVFDKGNVSEDNIKEIEDKVYFISSLVPCYHKDLLKIGIEEYGGRYKDLKVYECKKEIFGRERKVVVTYNEKLKNRQEKTFNEKIEKIKEEIKEIYERNKERKDVEDMIKKRLEEEYISNSKAKRYIEYEIKDNKISVRRKKKECEEKRLSFGKTILFTSKMDLSYEEVIKNYKGKHRIEDVFRLMNNDIYFTPVYHWTDSKIIVHAFVCVIALLLVKLLEYLAKREDINLRSEQIIEELREIKEAILIYPNKRVERKVMELSSPIQRKLFRIYGLDKFT